jgi:hypothetical protein
VIKLHHRTLFHLFSKVDDIRGHKRKYASHHKNPQINFCLRCPESILSCQHSQNIKKLKKNHFEAQMNAQNNKRQSLSSKIAAA